MTARSLTALRGGRRVPGLAAVALALVALGLAACGSGADAVPKPADVRSSLTLHGIDLRAVAEDAHGCVVMQPRATNSGAARTYGQFTLVIATEDSCNDEEMTGSVDDHIYWSHRGDHWHAKEKLQNNLWLHMIVPSHELGEQQHALQAAALHAFHSGN